MSALNWGSEEDRYLYSLGKLQEAIDVLATGEGRIKDRLYDAYRSIIPISSDYLPEVLRGDMAWVRAQLTKREPTPAQRSRGMGNLNATLVGMRNKTAVLIAHRILDLESRLDAILRERGVR